MFVGLFPATWREKIGTRRMEKGTRREQCLLERKQVLFVYLIWLSWVKPSRS